MRKIFYMGLESYESRYTLQLTEWNERVFKRRGVEYEIIRGNELTTDKQIVTGSVLDAHGRTFFSLTQTANLIKFMKEGKVTKDDIIFYEDMFTPGIESLPYIMDQIPKKYRPKVFVRCLAQTIDPDDFVNREGMMRWMRYFELMVDQFITGILVANEEMVAHLRIAGFKAPIYVTGLPFGKEEVLERVEHVKPISIRERRVAFAARFDDEKQPEFFMKLATACYERNPDIEFAVFTGNKELKSNNKNHTDFAKFLASSGNANFKIYTGLTKNAYYELLSDSVVLFNCALQDWWSNTISEAATLGTIPLFPAYRSFPETLANNEDLMYVPWSLNDALTKLEKIFRNPEAYNPMPLADYADQAIDRTIDIFEGKTLDYARNGLDYRKFLATPKYSWK